MVRLNEYQGKQLFSKIVRTKVSYFLTLTATGAIDDTTPGNPREKPKRTPISKRDLGTFIFQKDHNMKDL